MAGPSAPPGLTATARGFERASASFDAADAVHGEARERLLGRLDLLRAAPARILDLGCATGKGAVALARRYQEARVVALDSNLAMLAVARRRAEDEPRIALLAGDAEHLPIAARSIELVFANLLLPWCAPAAVFAEASRVLADDGVIVFSTLGPDTLLEVRRAWATVDESAHVHDFLDMHDIGDLALGAGLKDPVIDVDRLTVSYPSLEALVADLRAVGATSRDPRRRRTLTAPGRWRRFVAALRAAAGGAPTRVSIELVFGQAWGGGLTSAPTSPGAEEIGIPLERVRRRARGP